MKVYGPTVEYKEYNFSNYNDADYNAHEEAYYAELKKSLQELGYKGKLTGELVHFPVADGAAVYMVAEGNKTTILVHCPVGDAWHIPEWQTRGLRKSDIKQQIKNNKLMQKLFSKK